jgi:hypothetical protein
VRKASPRSVGKRAWRRICITAGVKNFSKPGRNGSWATPREATSTEVVELRKENARLKLLVAETVLEKRLLKEV